MSTDLLFDTPWWLPVAIALSGVAMLISGNARQKRPLLLGGLGVVALAAALAIMSWLVDTPLERAVRRTKDIVNAVERRDWPKFQSLLDQRTSFWTFTNRDELVATAKATADRIGLRSIYITGTSQEQLQTLIRVNINVLSDQEITGGRQAPTSWRFNYQDLGTGKWELTSIEALSNERIPPEQIHRQMVRP